MSFSPLPNSSRMQVAAWSRRGGKGQVPANVIRISSGPSSSAPGKYVVVFFTLGVGV